MFAVYGVNAAVMLFGQGHYDFAGGDKNFLCSEGYILAGFERGDCCADTHSACYGDDYCVGFDGSAEMLQLVFLAEYGVFDGHAELSALMAEECGVRMSGKADDAEAVRQAADDVEGLRADASC